MAVKPVVLKILREAHRREHPNCAYGDKPHYVPPGSGTIGYYLCDPPEDATNHTRCRPPYDHQHVDHR